MGARKSMDVGRVGAAVSRPGIDPRVWLTLATVTAVGFDPREGVFADVRFTPTGEDETAYFGTGYAGGGFGEHSPIEVDDTVLVAVPMGDSGNGPVIVARFNNAGDPPHADFGDGGQPSKDRITRVKPGQKLVMRTSAAGEILIESEGSGDVTVSTAMGSMSLAAPLGAFSAQAMQKIELTSLGGPINLTSAAAIGLAAAGGISMAPGAGGPGMSMPASPGAPMELGGSDGGPAADMATLATPTMADLNLLRADVLALKAATQVGLAAGGGSGPSYAGGSVQAAAFAASSAAVGATPLAPVAAQKVKIT